MVSSLLVALSLPVPVAQLDDAFGDEVEDATYPDQGIGYCT